MRKKSSPIFVLKAILFLLMATVALSGCNGTITITKEQPAIDPSGQNAAPVVPTEAPAEIATDIPTEAPAEIQTEEPAAAPTEPPTPTEVPTEPPSPTPEETPEAITETAEAPDPDEPEEPDALDSNEETEVEVEQVVTSGATGFACMGFDSLETIGATCLMPNGEWLNLTGSNSPLTDDKIKAMGSCEDGSLLMSTNRALRKFDGENWVSFNQDVSLFLAKELVCDAAGNIWVGSVNTLGLYDGKSWKFEDLKALNNDETFGLNDIAVTQSGSVWVVSRTQLGLYENGEWTFFTAGDFDKDGQNFSLKNVAVDESDTLWVLTNKGFLVYRNETFEEIVFDTLGIESDMYLGADSTVWFSSKRYGVMGFDLDTQGTMVFEKENSDLSHNDVLAFEIDDRGRFWLGTRWGLNVFDGESWTVYDMRNSPLSDHQVQSIAVIGDGPELPEAQAQGVGSMSGQLLVDDRPIDDATIVLCPVIFRDDTFYGDTPCPEPEASFVGSTDADGNFLLEEVDRGRYVMFIGFPDGGWTQFRSGGSELDIYRIFVWPGEETELDEINFNS